MGRSSRPPISGRTAATAGTASTRNSNTTTTGAKSRRCCSCPICCLLFLVIGAVGGVLIWKFLPESVKDGIGGTAGQIGQNITPNDPGTPPPSSFQWDELCNGTNADCCNGVPGLCGLKPDDILFATLHNAQATVEDGWLFAGNHEFSLERALLAGYRGINVDVGMCDGQVQLIHGMCNLGTRNPSEVWTNITRFLNNNPREVIIMPIEIVSQDDQEKVTLDALHATMPQEFLDLLYAHDPTTDFPTLQELIDLEKRILLFHYAGDSCSTVTCPSGFHEWFYYAAETKFENPSVDDVSCTVERGSNGQGYFYAINDFVSDPLPSKSAAETLNAKTYLENLIQSCSKIESRDVNLVLIDFWEMGDLVEVTQRHNLNLVQQQQSQQSNRFLRKKIV